MRKVTIKFNNEITKYTLITIIILSLLIVGTFIFKFFSSSKEELYLYDLMDSILDINNQCKSFVDNSNINVEKALETIPKMREKLYSIAINDINTEYASLPSHSSDYQNLSKGISENLLLLDQVQAMLNNPYGNDLELAADSLKIYRDTSESYYNLIPYNKSTFSLGISMHNFINETIDYCLSSNNSKKIDELKKAESEQFISTLNELTTSLNNIMENYYDKVMDCRSSKMTYQLLISKIDTNISKVEAIKNVLSQISIPNNFIDIYNSFSEVINLYNKYIYDVKYAVVTESVRRDTSDITSDYMDSLYESSTKTLENVEKKYKNFIKEYNKLNSNY